LGVLFRFTGSKLRFDALEKQYGGFYLKKYRKIGNFLFSSIFFKPIKDVVLFQAMDKGGQNNCSLRKKFFFQLHSVYPFKYGGKL